MEWYETLLLAASSADDLGALHGACCCLSVVRRKCVMLQACPSVVSLVVSRGNSSLFAPSITKLHSLVSSVSTVHLSTGTERGTHQVTSGPIRDHMLDAYLNSLQVSAVCLVTAINCSTISFQFTVACRRSGPPHRQQTVTTNIADAGVWGSRYTASSLAANEVSCRKRCECEP